MTQKFHDLVAGARSYRRFDQSKKMTMQELEELAELGRITPCGGNRQYIRFALCADEKMNAEIYKNLAWAGYLSDWDGPVEGPDSHTHLDVYQRQLYQLQQDSLSLLSV